jgi:hypothetical protein
LTALVLGQDVFLEMLRTPTGNGHGDKRRNGDERGHQVEQRVVQQPRKGEQMHSHHQRDPDGYELVPAPPDQQTRTGASQGELDADDDPECLAVSPSNAVPVFQSLHANRPPATRASGARTEPAISHFFQD